MPIPKNVDMSGQYVSFDRYKQIKPIRKFKYNFSYNCHKMLIIFYFFYFLLVKMTRLC
jgi:hypothetical protein